MTEDPFPPPSLLFALVDDLLDTEPSHLRTLLNDAQLEGRQAAELNFNTTDLTVHFATGAAVITDALDGEPEPVSLSKGAVLRPFELVEALPSRCVTYIKSQFGNRWKEAVVWLTALPSTGQDLERIVTAAVVQSKGDLDELRRAVSLGRTDWRDLLMNAGALAHEGWRETLDQLLGPEPQ